MHDSTVVGGWGKWLVERLQRAQAIFAFYFVWFTSKWCVYERNASELADALKYVNEHNDFHQETPDRQYGRRSAKWLSTLKRVKTFCKMMFRLRSISRYRLVSSTCPSSIQFTGWTFAEYFRRRHNDSHGKWRHEIWIQDNRQWPNPHQLPQLRFIGPQSSAVLLRLSKWTRGFEQLPSTWVEWEMQIHWVVGESL